MALTTLDRDLLKRCLHKEPGAWNDFVDRFLGLIYHVIHHTAHLRSMPLRPEDTPALPADETEAARRFGEGRNGGGGRGRCSAAYAQGSSRSGDTRHRCHRARGGKCRRG